MHFQKLILVLPALATSGILAVPVANRGMESRNCLPKFLPLM